jgi:Zn-dependent protease
MLIWTYLLNLHLAAFNLIPILPLDRSSVIKGLLPKNAALRFERLEPYGFVLLVLFLLSDLAPAVLRPLVALLNALVALPASALASSV